MYVILFLREPPSGFSPCRHPTPLTQSTSLMDKRPHWHPPRLWTVGYAGTMKINNLAGASQSGWAASARRANEVSGPPRDRPIIEAVFFPAANGGSGCRLGPELWILVAWDGKPSGSKQASALILLFSSRSSSSVNYSSCLLFYSDGITWGKSSCVIKECKTKLKPRLPSERLFLFRRLAWKWK